jgi:23S rRNA pseudouridine1911/1915/1917 synthase
MTPTHPFEVLYEDNHQLLVNKPAGMLTQPNDTADISLEELTKDWIKKRYQKPGNVFLSAIHRLDKPASGLVLFARTSKGLSRLQEAMRHGKIDKKYLALVEAPPKETRGVLEHYLVHDSHHARIAAFTETLAKKARLQYRVVHTQEEGMTLLEITLETGRYHQIRAQLSAIGLPILGDEKYGSRTAWAPHQIALHHYHMEWPHPITREYVTCNAPLPSRWPLWCMRFLA